MTNSILLSQTTGISLHGRRRQRHGERLLGEHGRCAGFPLFPNNLHVAPGLTADYHLTAGSPLLDAGRHVAAPIDDVDGEPRPMVGPSGLFRVDIGADERTGPAQHVTYLDHGPADLTIIGPGNPPENPNTPDSNSWIGYAVLGGDVTGDNQADLFTSAEDWSDDFDTDHSTGRLFGLFHFGTRITGTIDLLTHTADRPSTPSTSTSTPARR